MKVKTAMQKELEVAGGEKGEELDQTPSLETLQVTDEILHLEAEENGDEVEEFVELRRTTNTTLVRGIINTSEATYTVHLL